ncbi:hypothetical protein LJ737_05335 [Hymenobacter sp. 15J16-1T3B]|uniref:hypothetical protein n=1 Tax=Hymenobacter sp. 15J16-1T3B TaxID=2886941 RepID=UPI001D0FD5DB|nr:hypothetical protein [Hymenobacter sp. 15J16-1T3B]MCC3156650.1 hypothetical protein [Hymenobacter sp. 15J16-1T3B]
MRKLSLVCLTMAALWVAGCQKTDLNPQPTPTATLNADVATCTPDVITFDNVAAGTRPTSITSTGGVAVGVESQNPHYAYDREAIVFRSSPTVSSSEDTDLGSPNAAYGGVGIGYGGGPGAYANTTPLGNILVLHNFFSYDPNTEPNDDDFTENETPGTIGFNFSSPITATSITVIDVEYAYNSEHEYGYVKLYASKGGAQIGGQYNFSDAGPNGVEVVSLGNTPGVRYIEVTIGGSMGIDNLRFCRPAGHCTLTQGYWKNHSWPVQSLTLGGTTYTRTQLLAILNTPVRGNGLVALAYQLIAAKLNLANGSDGSVISADLAAADAMFVGKNMAADPLPSVPTSQTSTLTARLDDYNNGVIGPGHCDN